jgi:hypothetical protein
MIMTLLSKNGLTKALTRMTKKENVRAKPFDKSQSLRGRCRMITVARNRRATVAMLHQMIDPIAMPMRA